MKTAYLLFKPCSFIILILVSLCTHAQDAKELTSAELAKQAHNPLSNLKEIIFQLDVLPDVGPNKKTLFVETVQPVYPFVLNEDWKLVTYSIIPIVSQPSFSDDDHRTYGLGDTTLFGYFVPKGEGDIIWGVGPAIQVPTHTGDISGNDQWAAGPALIVGVQPGNWSIFGLWDNVWSVAGPDDVEINAFNFQYQAVYLFSDTSYFITNWTIEADWTAENDDKWTVPLGGGLGTAFSVGKQEIQMYAQVGYNVQRPDQASTWRAVLAVTLIL